MENKGLKTISELDTGNLDCNVCKGCFWVCESHPNVAWYGMIDGIVTCCEGAGMPCKCSDLYKSQ